MKTQLSILVKGDLLMWYTNLPIWILSKKAYIGLYIDQEPDQGGKVIKLQPKKEPYIIEVEPGEHEFWFVDSNEKNKKILSAAKSMGIGGSIGGIGGSISKMLDGATTALLWESNKKSIQDNYMHIVLQEGDECKILIKPGKKGAIKIQELN